MTVYSKSMMEALAEVRGLQEDNMDLMRKAAGGAMQTIKMKDGKLQMDSFTASAIMKVYDKVNPANQKKMAKMINDGKKSGIMKLQDFAMKQVKSENDPEIEEEVELDERERQLKDPKKEMMISYKDRVMVIDKKDWPKYEKKGAIQAEEVDLDEARKDNYYTVGGDRYDGGVVFTVYVKGKKVHSQILDGAQDYEFKGKKYKDVNKAMDAIAKAHRLKSSDFKKVNEEVELDEAKYEIYHKDFSSAMQHAYKAAKKMYGITVDPKEIDDKVATGPRKPSKGKTNSYRLKGDKGAIQVQVANLDNKKYELNMYKESHEMGTDEYRKYLEDLTPHSTESARSDAMRAMRRDKSMIRGKDSADVDDVATKDDRKAASKNILQQLKKTLDTKGKTDIEFLDKKKKKVPYDIAVKAVKKYMGFRSSTDKLKFQQALAKSYKSMLQAVKEDYVVPKTHSESILDRIDTKLKEKKNG